MQDLTIIDPVKKRLRRLHKLLVSSRYALDHVSGRVSLGWLGELLFMLSCRRVLMLAELDRELGRMHVPTRPGPDVDHHFNGYQPSVAGQLGYVELCEAEDSYVVRELELLKVEPGLQSHTRAAIAALLRETRANLENLGYIRKHHPAMRGV